MKRIYLFATAAVVTLLPMVALAQTAEAPSSAPPHDASADSTLMGEIIVTATRREERLQDVPITVTAQTGKQLDRAGVNDVRELQRIVPGLTFTSQGAWAQPSLRGITTISSGAGGDSPISIYIDGVYQQSQMANLFEMPDVDRIEVLKGPQGTLFGRNATGGAIQIFTREPTFTPTGMVTGTYGYYTGGAEDSSAYGVKGFLSGPIVADKLAGSISFNWDETQGYLHNDVTGDREGRIRNALLRVKLLYEPTDKIKLETEIHYLRKRDNANTTPFPIGGVSAIAGYAGAILATEPWHTTHEFPTYIHNEAFGAWVRGTFDFDVGTLTSLTAFQYVRNNVRVDVHAGYLPPGPVRDQCFNYFICIDYGVGQPSETRSQEFNFASRKFGSFSFVAGAFAYSGIDQSILAVQIGQPGGPLSQSAAKARTTALAAFSEANYDVTSRLTFVLGMRYSWERKSTAVRLEGVNEPDGGSVYQQLANAHWDAWTPRASIRYSLDDATNVYFTYSQGFKSGVIDQFTTNVAAPENITSYEIGAKRRTSLYSVDLSLFYYDYRDLQVQNFDGIKDSTSNAANATIYGLDFDGSIRATDDLQLRLGVSYLPVARYSEFVAATFYDFPRTAAGTLTEYTNQDISGHRMIRTPKVTATLSAHYVKEISRGKVDADASLYYTGSYIWEASERVKTGSYVTLNGQVSFTPANSNFRFSLFGKNLNNTAFIQGVVESANSDMGIYAPPREIGLSVGYAF